MIKVLYARLKQGYRTIAFPEKKQVLPERFRGSPVIDISKCSEGCDRECVKACPTGAIKNDGRTFSVDLGKCLFCVDCSLACPKAAISYSRDFSLAGNKREDLIYTGDVLRRADMLDKEIRRVLGRSLKLRQVSAGGCNACEADINVLNTVVFDLARFGIQFVASPRHADGLLLTGPVSENMRLALKKTYEAMPFPKIVIAVGACAVSGGIYIDHPETSNGVDSLIKADLYIPGCPPHPLTILDGLLRLLGKKIKH
jgi:Ni,Fe-hydrogenase III small subunit/formate hydrogenlyase subunit 6/NADH:ubiquinone oxidoreductase subunit I